MKKDDLGNRMKDFYESRTKLKLTRRTFTVIRIDGKAFHTYTRNLIKPFDLKFIEDMDKTAIYLCENIQGTKLAFVQSDEISIILTDFDKLTTDAYFDGNIQKITSITASMATAKFNQLRILKKTLNSNKIYNKDIKLATFDSRVFTIPYKTEVINYLIWRQQDTVRNSIQSVAQSLYSHKQLNGKNTAELQEMIFQKGINWNNYDPKLKHGRLIIKEYYQKNAITRSRWISINPEEFTKNNSQINNIIPNYI